MEQEINFSVAVQELPDLSKVSARKSTFILNSKPSQLDTPRGQKWFQMGFSSLFPLLLTTFFFLPWVNSENIDNTSEASYTQAKPIYLCILMLQKLF